MNLKFQCHGETVLIQLDRQAAPRTVAALLARLPADVDLHCAKIAGDQILFPLPFVVDLEQDADVAGVDPGSLIYWPERQLFGLFYGPVQKERASVAVVGRVVNNMEGLRAVGQRLQQEHGRGITWARLEIDGIGDANLEHAAPAGHDPNGEIGRPITTASPGVEATAEPDPAKVFLQKVRQAREAMWAGIPAEVTELVNRRGVMLPVGPLLYGESETRKLHELLWAVRERAAGRDGDASPWFTETLLLLLEHGAARLRDLVGLEEAAAFLLEVARWLREHPQEGPALLDELLLYTGRLNNWLDLFIPWDGFNTVLREGAR